MNQEYLKMQKLAGIITEAQYYKKKQLAETQLNEDILELKQMSKQLYLFFKKEGYQPKLTTTKIDYRKEKSIGKDSVHETLIQVNEQQEIVNVAVSPWSVAHQIIGDKPDWYYDAVKKFGDSEKWGSNPEILKQIDELGKKLVEQLKSKYPQMLHRFRRANGWWFVMDFGYGKTKKGGQYNPNDPKNKLMEDDEILGKTGVTKLSAVDKDLAKAAVMNSAGRKDGDQGDDVVAGAKKSIAVSDLRASQTEIRKDKAISMAVSFLLKGNYDNADLGAIVSGDKPAYIMDGHHRWAATYLIDPKAKLQVTQIELPGQALVSALNVVTVGGLGKIKGNTGEGSVKEFTGANIGELLDQYLKEGIPGKEDKDNPKNSVPPTPPEKVKEALGKVPGANGNSDKGKNIMMKNADALPKKIMLGAPPRVEMPVIDPKAVKLVQALLQKGAIDIKPPYSQVVKDKLPKAGGDQDTVKESVRTAINNMLKEAIKKGKV